MKRLIYIVIAALILSVFLHAEDIRQEISGDSLIVVLHQSFIMKIDSAVDYANHDDYRNAVRLYAAAFNDLEQFNKHRREHAEKYLVELYETEQNEQRILFLDEVLPLKKKQNILLIALCVILIVMLVALFVFRKYHLRNIRQKAEQVENETRLVELEREERTLENRLRTMEVEKYQKELLAESLLINHKNKVLEDLRLFLVHNPKLNDYREELEKILSDATDSLKNKAFKTKVNDIHPTFYTHLQQQAANKLTNLDLEYCRMIFMRMSSKEMAELLGVEPETIRMGKYRLKKKLGLGKGEELDGFIERIGKKR